MRIEQLQEEPALRFTMPGVGRALASRWCEEPKEVKWRRNKIRTYITYCKAQAYHVYPIQRIPQENYNYRLRAGCRRSVCIHVRKVAVVQHTMVVYFVVTSCLCTNLRALQKQLPRCCCRWLLFFFLLLLSLLLLASFLYLLSLLLLQLFLVSMLLSLFVVAFLVLVVVVLLLLLVVVLDVVH